MKHDTSGIEARIKFPGQDETCIHNISSHVEETDIKISIHVEKQ